MIGNIIEIALQKILNIIVIGVVKILIHIGLWKDMDGRFIHPMNMRELGLIKTGAPGQVVVIMKTILITNNKIKVIFYY